MRGLGKCFVVVALAVSASTAGAQHVPKLSVQNYKSEIEMLLALSAENASKQPKADVDPRIIAGRCADQLEKARSYGSLARILDRGNKELAAHGSVGISWAFDHVEPDRYHVVQDSWGGGPSYDFDEWITIGTSQFDFTGFWMEGLVLDVPGWDPRQQNQRLGLQKYLQILRSEQPSFADIYSYGSKHYDLLVYLLPVGGDYKAFLANVNGSAKLLMWIDSESGSLAKAYFVPTTSPSASVPLEFEQVFVGYSGDVHIEPPGEKCSKSRPGMCFASRILQPGKAPRAVTAKSTTPEKPSQEIEKLRYSSPVYSWSVSYPNDWTIDSKDPNDVRISPPSDDGVCGLHSGAVRFKTVGEFTDFMQENSRQFFKEKGTTTRSSPKQRISLPNDVIGIDVLTEILSGGRSRRIYVLADGVGYNIDCETYASNWEKLAPFFAQIISSFTLERKP